jgi:hypothetical protein
MLDGWIIFLSLAPEQILSGIVFLKEQYDQIFGLCFFRESTPNEPLSHTQIILEVGFEFVEIFTFERCSPVSDTSRKFIKKGIRPCRNLLRDVSDLAEYFSK